jgi:hypothetical protein
LCRRVAAGVVPPRLLAALCGAAGTGEARWQGRPVCRLNSRFKRLRRHGGVHRMRGGRRDGAWCRKGAWFPAPWGAAWLAGGRWGTWLARAEDAPCWPHDGGNMAGSRRGRALLAARWWEHGWLAQGTRLAGYTMGGSWLARAGDAPCWLHDGGWLARAGGRAGDAPCWPHDGGNMAGSRRGRALLAA